MRYARHALNLISRLRGRIRFRIWASRTRLTLARLNCRLELVAPHGAAWQDSPPSVIPALKLMGEWSASTPGRLRIEIGRHVHLGRGTTLEILPSADSVLTLGDGVICGNGLRLALYGGQLKVGGWCQIRDGVMLKSSGRLDIGEHAEVSNYSMIHCADAVSVGDYAGLAERISVMDSDHPADGSDRHMLEQPLAVEPVSIGANVFVGANSVILRGARLGRNGVVAAGSVVRGGDYPAGWLVAGAPAEAKKPLPAAARAEQAT